MRHRKGAKEMSASLARWISGLAMEARKQTKQNEK